MIAETIQVAAGLCVAAYAGNRANHHRPGTSWLDRITVALIGAAGLLAVVGVPLSRLPVVIDARAEVISHTPGVARLHIVGTKPESRRACELLDLDAYVIAGGRAFEAPLSIEGDPRAGNTRPPGRHDFGTWRVDYPQALVPSAVLFTARHRCAWWMPPTRTEQGPFALPPPQGDMPRP